MLRSRNWILSLGYKVEIDTFPSNSVQEEVWFIYEYRLEC
jgi:hypothetical protein